MFKHSTNLQRIISKSTCEIGKLKHGEIHIIRSEVFILLCAELVGPPGFLIGVIIIRLLSGTIVNLIKKSVAKK